MLLKRRISLFKDKEHFIQELTKSIQKDIASKVEELEKAKKVLFTPGSTIHIKKATKGKGYEVHEHHENGDITNHGDIGYASLDARMPKGKKNENLSLLRMKDSKHEGVPLHHSAKVKHISVQNGGRKWKEEKLHPEGEPHAIGRGGKED